MIEDYFRQREIVVGELYVDQIQNHALTILGKSHDFWQEQLDVGRNVGEILAASVYLALIISRVDIRKAMSELKEKDGRLMSDLQAFEWYVNIMDAFWCSSLRLHKTSRNQAIPKTSNYCVENFCLMKGKAPTKFAYKGFLILRETTARHAQMPPFYICLALLAFGGVNEVQKRQQLRDTIRGIIQNGLESYDDAMFNVKPLFNPEVNSTNQLGYFVINQFHTLPSLPIKAQQNYERQQTGLYRAVQPKILNNAPIDVTSP
ncbi:MAG: hypothetical protein EZS28_019279, partial [Streblomastix strix]